MSISMGVELVEKAVASGLLLVSKHLYCRVSAIDILMQVSSWTLGIQFVINFLSFSFSSSYFFADTEVQLNGNL